MVLLIAMFQLTPARADGPDFSDLPSLVETSLGAFSGHELSGFCRSPNIVMVRVESIEPIRDKWDVIEASRLKLRVEHTVRAPSDRLDGQLLSAAIPDLRARDAVRPGSHRHLQPVVGSVWVVGYTPMARDHGYARRGDPFVSAFRHLTDETQAMWTEKLPDVLDLDCWSVRPL